MSHAKLSHADTARVNEEGSTPLMMACQRGNIEQVRLLLQQQSMSEVQKDNNGRTALHYCSDTPDMKSASLLLDNHGDLLDMADDQGFTALHLGVIAGNTDLISLLLTRGANITATDCEHHSVAHWATVCGQVNVVDILVDHGADLSCPDVYDAYPMHYAAQLATQSGDRPKSPSKGIEMLCRLISTGVSLSVLDKDKRQPLLWAANAGNHDGCTILVRAGAKVNATDKDGLSAVHCAASKGHSVCIEALVRKCAADPDIEDHHGCTPVFYAISLSHLDCANKLLDLGANPNHVDKRRRSPVHCAAVRGSLDSLQLLLARTGNVWLRSMKGEYPIHEATQAGHKEAVIFLLNLRNGSNCVNLANSYGRTCLHIAAVTNNLELCRLLLEKGANINAIMQNKVNYYTPYDAARLQGNTEVAEYLHSHGGATGQRVGDNAASVIQRGARKHLLPKPVTKTQKYNTLEVINSESGTGKLIGSGVAHSGDNDQGIKQMALRKVTSKAESPEQCDMDRQISDKTSEGETSVDSGNSEKTLDDKTQKETSRKVSFGSGTSPIIEPNNPQVKKTKQLETQNRSSIREESKYCVILNGVSHNTTGDQEVKFEQNSRKELKCRKNSGKDLQNKKQLTLESQHSPGKEVNYEQTSVKERKTQQTSTKEVKPQQIAVKEVKSEPTSEKEIKPQQIVGKEVRSQQTFEEEEKNQQSAGEDRKQQRSRNDLQHQHSFVKDVQTVKKTDTSVSDVNDPQLSRISRRKTGRARPSPNHSRVNLDGKDESSSVDKGGKPVVTEDDGLGNAVSDIVGQHQNEDSKISAHPDRNSPKQAPNLESRRGQPAKCDKNRRLGSGSKSAHRYSTSNSSSTSHKYDILTEIQSSVKEYEGKRRAMKELQQIRRAQIYAGPIKDAILVQQLVEQYEDSPHADSVKSLEQWDTYLQDQLQFISHLKKNGRYKSISSTAQEEHSRMEVEATQARQRTVQSCQDMEKQAQLKEDEDREKRLRDEEEVKVIVERTEKLFNDINTRADVSVETVQTNNGETLNNQQSIFQQTRSSNGSSTPSAGHEENGRIHSSTDRKVREKDMERKTREKYQKRLLQAYRPDLPINLDPRVQQNGYNQRVKCASVTCRWRPQTGQASELASRSKTSISTKPQGSSMTNQRREQEYTTIITRYGMQKVRNPANPTVSQSQNIWVPKHNGSLHARPGLMFMEPKAYSEKVKDDRRRKKELWEYLQGFEKKTRLKRPQTSPGPHDYHTHSTNVIHC